MTASGWRVEFHGSLLEDKRVEVFISPSGDWYRRAGKGDPVDFERPAKSPGLPSLKLTNINHWRPTP